MSQNLQQVDTTALLSSMSRLTSLQAQFYSLFMNPEVAMKMYQDYLTFLFQSATQNAQIMSAIPNACMQTRKVQPAQ